MSIVFPFCDPLRSSAHTGIGLARASCWFSRPAHSTTLPPLQGRRRRSYSPANAADRPLTLTKRRRGEPASGALAVGQPKSDKLSISGVVFPFSFPWEQSI